jgi:hypothetical protein
MTLFEFGVWCPSHSKRYRVILNGVKDLVDKELLSAQPHFKEILHFANRKSTGFAPFRMTFYLI